jgi:hypothetical protein
MLRFLVLNVRDERLELCVGEVLGVSDLLARFVRFSDPSCEFLAGSMRTGTRAPVCRNRAARICGFVLRFALAQTARRVRGTASIACGPSLRCGVKRSARAARPVAPPPSDPSGEGTSEKPRRASAAGAHRVPEGAAVGVSPAARRRARAQVPPLTNRGVRVVSSAMRRLGSRSSLNRAIKKNVGYRV